MIDPAMIQTPLTGIVPPMITPLRDRDALDLPGLERLIAHVLDGGVSGLFILGTTGEGPGLSYRLRRELIDRTCRQVGGRVPVLVGITDTAMVEAVGLARHAANAGAAAVVAAPPYYLPGGQPELREYLGHLVRELPLPLFLYNMPALTKVPFDIETVRAAMDDSRVIGLKDSSGDMTYFQSAAELLPQRPDWTLLIGPEERLLDAVLAGGHGGVCGGANLFPALFVALYEACRAGDANRAFRMHAQMLRVSSSIYRVGRHPSAVIKGLKCALSITGICDDFMAEPFHRFREGERAVIAAHVVRLQAEIAALGV